MAVVVNGNEPIDQALKRLHREVVRENILEKFKEKRFFIKPTTVGSAIRREFKKQKVKRRKANRKLKNKG